MLNQNSSSVSVQRLLLASLLGLFAAVVLLTTRVEATNAVNKKSSATGTKKMTTASTLKSGSKTMNLLTFDQVNELAYGQRVQYVKMLREAMVGIERIQYAFKDSTFKNAGSEKSYDDVYALLLGEDANAEADRLPGRQCIYAFHLSKYKGPQGSEKRVPFNCEIVESCNESGSGGVRCDYFLSGISASNPLSCIPSSIRYKATETCNERRDQMSTSNSAAVKRSITNADSFFGFSLSLEEQKKKKLDDAFLQSQEAAQMLKELASNAYDDGVYAQLIKVIGLYKAAGVNLPIDKIRFPSEREKVAFEHIAQKIADPKTFASTFDFMNASIEGIFNAHTAHCDEKLSDDEIKYVRSAEYRKLAQQSGRGPRYLAKLQIDAEAEIRKVDAQNKAGQKIPYTNRTVLETRECQAVDKIYGALKSRARELAGTRPSVPPPPAAPPKAADSIVKSLGCGSVISGEKEHVFQMAARCSACVADKAMNQSAKNESDPEKKRAKETYSVSPKWLSLMSTMVQACGDGKDSLTNIPMDVMLQYLYTFGHCDSEAYDWDQTSPLSADDKKVIQTWQKESFWKGKTLNESKPENQQDKKYSESVNDDFARIYGITYETATRVFCDPNRFSNNPSFLGFGGGIKAYNTSYSPLSRSQSIQRGRDAFTKALADDSIIEPFDDSQGAFPTGSSKKVAKALYQCMQDSKKNMKDLYAGNQNYCMRSVPIRSPSDFETVKSVFADLNSPNNSTTVLFDPGNCYVAQSIETCPSTVEDKNPNNWTRMIVNMVTPTWWLNSDPKAPNVNTAQMRYCGTKPGEQEPSMAVFATPHSQRLDGKGYVASTETPQNYYVLVPSSDCSSLQGWTAPSQRGADRK